MATSARTSPRSAPNVFPASQYLQERLDERRARRTQPKQPRQSDIASQTSQIRDDDIFVREGDTSRARAQSRTTGSLNGIQRLDINPVHEVEKSGPTRSTGGMRHLNEQLDRMTKLNFDLKLELDHRRAHQVKLNAEIEHMRTVADRAEQLAAEHTELLKINGELVEELEKRDRAMQEAVEIICDLEERVADLEDDRQSVTRASTIHADSGYAGTETLDASSASPEKTKHSKTPLAKIKIPLVASAKLNSALKVTSPKSNREPSFMIQDNAGTRTLKSVYQNSSKQLRPIKSFHSILSKHTSTIDDDDWQGDSLNSPGLSNLSESSFPSIYAPRQSTAIRNAWEPKDILVPGLTTVAAAATHGLHTRQDSISRVSQWIEDHDAQHVASQGAGSARALSPMPNERFTAQSERFQSLNNTLSTHDIEHQILQQDIPFRPHTAHQISRHSSRTPTSFGGPIFGEPLLSRADDKGLKLLKASRSTIVDEKSLSDAPNARFHALQALDCDMRTTPKQMRSSLELKDAYARNLEYRKTGFSHMRQVADLSSSPDDDDDSDMRGEVRGYLGYPDGGSILLGTPSRFFQRDHSTKRAPRTTQPQQKTEPVTRRKSSSAATADTRRPDLVRAGTSPNMLPSLMTMETHVRPKTPLYGDPTSPISYQSTSSSNRTAYASERRDTLPPTGARSPPTRHADRVPASPARTLSQKTQSILRRLSGSHGSERERHRQISPSPSRTVLPTLTSTPSSAYVNIIPKDMRRANAVTADISRSGHPLVSTPTTVRTRADSEVRHMTPNTDTIVEKRGFFGRRGSFKQVTGIDRAKTATPSGRGRRRSSMRDTIASGKR